MIFMNVSLPLLLTQTEMICTRGVKDLLRNPRYDTGAEYGEPETESGNSIVFESTVTRYVRHWSGRSDRNTGIHFMEMDIYGLGAPQFSTCAIELHEHYLFSDGFAISGHGAPNPCYDARSAKWRSPTSLFYDDVHECENMCDADKHCVAFVHNHDAEPPYCVFKSSAEMHASPAKDVHLKDDTVDFETHMTASRGRHCQCARIQYISDEPYAGPPAIIDIWDIQQSSGVMDENGNDLSPLYQQQVRVMGLVIAANDGSFFVQDHHDLAGLYIYDDSLHPEVGDAVDLTGEVNEYWGVTELVHLTAASAIQSHGNELPIPARLRPGNMAEEHEGLLVTVEGTCQYSSIGHGEWVITDGRGALIIDDMLDDSSFSPVYNRIYRVEGVGHFSWGNYKVEATSVQDLGAGRLVGAEEDQPPFVPPPPPPPPPPPGGGH